MKTSLAYIHLTKINLLFINRTKGYWLNYLTYMASLEFEKATDWENCSNSNLMCFFIKKLIRINNILLFATTMRRIVSKNIFCMIQN